MRFLKIAVTFLSLSTHPVNVQGKIKLQIKVEMLDMNYHN